MTTRIFRSLEGRLAGVALLLGLVAAFGSPSDSATVTIDTRELAAIVETEVDHVTVQELADWIIQDVGDVRLIDLGPPDEYAEYHIPGAENVQLTELLDYPLYRNERIILYSGGGIHSAQAWFLLKAHGFHGAYILLGGIESWKDEILFPEAPENPMPDALNDFRRTAAISAFFGGRPKDSASGGEAVSVALPKVEAPPVAPLRAKPRRKAKEGC